jgi:hypothetical protein
MTDLPLKSAERSAISADSGWSGVVATIENPDLITVVIFSVIGFLVTLNLILRVPDFAAIL